uniref:Uncharacterized protein n=1 Tax=Alexandrium andersonii TaxID=327968 RepID=A0A7S2GRE8_9DINO|mmetsp:Transcript_6029/g.13721  ORF Transcript_6029/g.13721 Transcript_6029/m.13721 type:complete len:156 (+) Transcript_6029:93-560(+)
MAPSPSTVAQDLVCFIIDEGGHLSPSSAAVQKFYSMCPQHKDVIRASGGNLRTFCQGQSDYLTWKETSKAGDQKISVSPSSVAAAISLAYFVKRHVRTSASLLQLGLLRGARVEKVFQTFWPRRDSSLTSWLRPPVQTSILGESFLTLWWPSMQS